MDAKKRRLVIISNRLPVIIDENNGKFDVKEGTGGLVTALAPVLRNRGGVWIGWSGSDYNEEVDALLASSSGNTGYQLKPVNLSSYEIDKYYQGFANEIIWPLFHDLQSRCNFDPEYWQAYKGVNKKFAEVIIENITTNDYIWIHDYHLMNVSKELRLKIPDIKIGFFLHIPFPPLDIFLKLPWRQELLSSLLEYDLIGFQTMRDRRNFIHCVRTLIEDVEVKGKGQVITVQSGNRKIKVGHFPISIDYKNFTDKTATREVSDCAWFIHENLSDRQILLGIDRLDYTKGIVERLKGFEKSLIKYPELRGKASFIQIVVPSRTRINEYMSLRSEIEEIVGNINGRFTKYGWVPIHYIFGHLDFYELLAYYKSAEIAVITPLKDGMNLVAKEYCACNLDDNGVLILSEFAGASAQLHRGAIMVNPYDVDKVADSIYQAFKMSDDEKRSRMRKMRQGIKKQDIFWWVDTFLQAAFTENLNNFPVLEHYDYMPQIEISN
jgi:trehalose 6-phosphate synthase/phosphatase